MKHPFLRLLVWMLAGLSFHSVQAEPERTSVPVVLVWTEAPVSGTVTADHGTVGRMKAVGGRVQSKESSFRLSSGTRLQLRIDRACTTPGPDATVVHVKADRGSFSFLLRDVTREYPIYLPDFGVVVLPGDDNRSYADVASDVQARGSRTKLQRIESEPENSFDAAARTARDMTVPARLGLGRDIRMFQITEDSEDTYREDKEIRPLLYAVGTPYPETGGAHIHYKWSVGRGVGYRNNIVRRLDEGALPIYHTVQQDDDVCYRTVSFVSPERASLNSPAAVQGTDFMIADKYSSGRAFTPDQQVRLDDVVARTPELDQELLLCVRTEIENTGSVPRYAWFRVPRAGAGAYQYDAGPGFSGFSPDRIFCVARLDGVAPRNEEMSLLLLPGQKACFDFYLSHAPVSAERAARFVERPMEERLAEARAYWNRKLAQGARVKLPEPRIDQMLRAGLLHLDQITFGREPDKTLTPSIGVYPPIGTESAPIVQFYLSMGWNDQARRCLDYFLETQQQDGRVENFYGYTVETGAALWSIGEYFRYTRDTAWIAQVKPRLLKAADFLMAWRERNKKDELRGRGYGLVEGKVADPEDPFRQFMLNGYSYLGLQRMAEVMAALGDPVADIYRREASDWRNDIRNAFFAATERSPVVPLGDGSWCSSTPPWAEADAPRLLYLDRERFWSHGTFSVPDALLGPVYLLFCEVLDPEEPAAGRLLDYHRELLCQENSVFSQPYYSRHNWCQVRRGEVKPFLSTYYNTVAAHADRETYFFWEHLFRLTPNKTHEEANFLMDTRWMLYIEQADTLHLFRTVPRAWFRQGGGVTLDGVQSYFGALRVQAVSHPDAGYIEAEIVCDSLRRPDCVTVRLPHPDGRKPVRVTGGVYDADREAVVVSGFTGSAAVRLEF